MEEPLKLLFKILLALMGGVSSLIALCLVLFTAIMFLVPTSSPYQAEEWQQTMVTLWGIQMTQLWLKRLQVTALGIGLMIPFLAISKRSRLWRVRGCSILATKQATVANFVVSCQFILSGGLRIFNFSQDLGKLVYTKL